MRLSHALLGCYLVSTTVSLDANTVADCNPMCPQIYTCIGKEEGFNEGANLTLSHIASDIQAGKLILNESYLNASDPIAAYISEIETDLCQSLTTTFEESCSNFQCTLAHESAASSLIASSAFWFRPILSLYGFFQLDF